MANGEEKGGSTVGEIAKVIGILAGSALLPGFGQAYAKGQRDEVEQARQAKEDLRRQAIKRAGELEATGDPGNDLPLLQPHIPKEMYPSFVSGAEQVRRENEASTWAAFAEQFGGPKISSGEAPEGAPVGGMELLSVRGGPKGPKSVEFGEAPAAAKDRRNRVKWDRNINKLMKQKRMTRQEAIAETYATPGFEAVPDRYVDEVPAIMPGPEAIPSIAPDHPGVDTSLLKEQPEIGVTRADPLGQGTAAMEELQNIQPREGESTGAFRERKRTMAKAAAELDIPITDSKVLQEWIDENGQPPPAGVTHRWIADNGYRPATPAAKKLKGGTLAVLGKMAGLFESEYRGTGRVDGLSRYWRYVKGEKEIQDISNFEATLGNLIQDIADEGRRVSDADAKRFQNLRFSLFDTEGTSFSKMVFVVQMLERSYLGVGKPVPPELKSIKRRYNIPTIEVSPDPSIPIEDAVLPGRAIPAPTQIKVEGFEGFSLGPEMP